MSEREGFAAEFQRNQSRYLEQWKTFLSFRSISTDPAFEKPCRECVEWLRDHLTALGLSARVIETAGKPLLFAERPGKPGRPTVLFYGHYDVQPVDPVELWNTDPFTPELKDGRMYARGAQDNKGQVFYVIKAIEHLIASDNLDCSLKILIEGEEEIGSGSLSESLPELAPLLKADVMMVCDTGVLDRRFSTIMMGLRGIVSLEFRLKGPNYDLHSGVHGGVAKNPALEVARLLARLHHDDGSIAIPKFYDAVEPVDPEDRRLANELPIDAAWYRGQVGVDPSGGEQGYTPAERRGFRPTIEINGIYGGYAGEGRKTIIPSYAGAKISSRLVASQSPSAVLQSITDFLREHAPRDLEFQIIDAEPGGAAFRGKSTSPLIQKAREVLREVTPEGVLLNWEGASIPIVTGLAEATGAEPLLVGYGLEEDCIHAPNESFSLEQFEKGFLYTCMMLRRLSA